MKLNEEQDDNDVTLGPCMAGPSRWLQRRRDPVQPTQNIPKIIGA